MAAIVADRDRTWEPVARARIILASTERLAVAKPPDAAPHGTKAVDQILGTVKLPPESTQSIIWLARAVC